MLQAYHGPSGVAARPPLKPLIDMEPALGLSALGKRLTLKAGRAICADGDAAEHCYKIVSGVVRTVKYTQDGRRQICDFLMPGDIIGLECRTTYTFTAETLTTCVIVQVPRRSVDGLMRDYPAVAVEIKDALAKALGAVRQRLVLLCKMPARERIVWLMLRIARGADAVEMPMPRGDIADYLGLAHETVSRVITELREAGLIATEGPRRIVFHDRTALEEIRDALGTID